MSTEKQIEANRQNAQKSTGPKTPEGKQIVAQNAVKHGLMARRALISGESQTEFDEYKDALLKSLGPKGSAEQMLADRIVTLSWRLVRAEKLQTGLMNILQYNSESSWPRPQRNNHRNRRYHSYQKPAPDCDRQDFDLGAILKNDLENANVLPRMIRYERQIEIGLHRTLQQFHKLQGIRKAEALRKQKGFEDAMAKNERKAERKEYYDFHRQLHDDNLKQERILSHRRYRSEAHSDSGNRQSGDDANFQNKANFSLHQNSIKPYSTRSY